MRTYATGWLPDIDPGVTPGGSAALIVGVAVYLTYLVVVWVLWRRAGVDYVHLGDGRDTITGGIVRPIGIAAALVVVATTVLGWWGPVLFDSPRADVAWWVWVAPALMGVGALAGVLTLDWGSREARHTLLPLALGCLFVGVAEEVLTRGLLLVGAREAGWSELAAASLATVLFSLIHLVNRWFGLTWSATATQLGLSLLAGIVFYLTRSATGTLMAAIVVHALWDLGTLGGQRHGRGPRVIQPIAAVLAYLAAVVTVVGLVLKG